MANIEWIKKRRGLKNVVRFLERVRNKGVLECFEDYLKKGDRILDFGCGLGGVSEKLVSDGYEVVSLDVRDISLTDVKPVIYDGKKIPFKNDSFDVALVLAVLHHTPDPEKLLKEIGRVAERIVLLEDVYDDWFGKYITLFFDSLFNLEFFGHPHCNKSDKEWKECFKKLGFSLVGEDKKRSMVFFKHGIYFLEREKNS